MISVFIDTFIVLNLTVFSILTTDSLNSGKDGIMLTQYAFSTVFGSFGDIFIAVCLLFFAFSTILGWSLYGTRCTQFLFGLKATKIFQGAFIVVVVLGSVASLDTVWDVADTFNGLMAIPNFIAVFALSGVVAKETRKFFSNPLRRN